MTLDALLTLAIPVTSAGVLIWLIFRRLRPKGRA